MASLNRNQLHAIYCDAFDLYKYTRSKSMKAKAKRIAVAIEQVIGQCGSVPAEHWA